tara:strand:- start:1140 stop:1370 length:231 start_codon:yes stop_codon:yes gene_type:complete
MDIGDQFSLEHLLFKERKCRICNKTKNLIEDFYMTRKTKRGLPSAYAYECKDCTISRILNNRNKKRPLADWQYPDW